MMDSQNAGESDSDNSDVDENTVVQIKESSSESDEDLECDKWDNDCIVVAQQPRKNAICGFHLMPTCPQEHEVPPNKRRKVPEVPSLSSFLTEHSFLTSFRASWESEKAMTFENKTVELTTDPFRFCTIDNFIDDLKFLDEIRQEFYEVEWNRRSMDLYEFFQSKDLAEVEHKQLKKFYELLKTDVIAWMRQLTGLELDKVSATCSVYTDTDYLLVHDDLQEDRSIAFVLYLTDPIYPIFHSRKDQSEELWMEEMGGLLELFSRDENGHPFTPVTRILPKNNRFIFFKVTNASYHQVSEVLNMNSCRMSINGWFHVPKREMYEPPPFKMPSKGLFSEERLPPLYENVSLQNWITPYYLRDDVKKQIQEQIESESEISLPGFFLEEKFQELCETLGNDDILWEKVGPPNRRNYEVISDKVAPNIVKELLTIFQSQKIFALLKDYTDLDLVTDKETDTTPTVRLELQRWKPGCYSLFSEYNWEAETELDVIMYIGNEEEFKVVGGQTVYVCTTKKIEDALVTLETTPNCLNIVFRDTARIMEHVSRRSSTEYFYVIVCSYKEYFVRKYFCVFYF